ncbi:MAG: Hpt domain-containing protein [bacterium]
MTDTNMRQGGGAALPQPSDEIIALYQQHVPDYLSELLDAVEQDDQEKVMFQCHKMCSAMRTMGFDNIAEILEEIQRIKPQGEELKELSSRVETLVNHTLLLLDK